MAVTRKGSGSPAARAKKASIRPGFEEAEAPSDTWRAQRAKLLGTDPDDLARRLRSKLTKTSGPKRKALKAALQLIPQRVAEADERIELLRYRDGVGTLVTAGRATAELARVRVLELEHHERVEMRAIALADSNETMRSRKRRVESVRQAFSPHLERARRVAALTQELLELETTREHHTGWGDLGTKRSEVLVDAVADALIDGGYTTSEAGRLLLPHLSSSGANPAKAIQARRGRRRRAEAQAAKTVLGAAQAMKAARARAPEAT